MCGTWQPEVQPNCGKHMLTNAAPVEPTLALADGVSAMDDPDIKKIRRSLRLKREEKLACWEDQIEMYILSHDGIAKRDRYCKEIKDGKREDMKMDPKVRAAQFEFDHHHKQAFAALVERQKA